MNLSHENSTPFTKPETGKRYASHDYGWVAITEYQANRVSKYKEYPDSAYFGIGINGVGMGGESLVRKRVVPWNEYTKLNTDLQEAAISSTECIVEPPCEWRLAVKSAVSGYLWPEEHSAGTLMFHYPDALWNIDSYHNIAENASIVAEIPDEHIDELHDKVSFEEPEAGHIYLNTYGNACVYSKITNTSSMSCTRYKLSEINPVIVDLEDTYILPVEEQDKFTPEELGDFEWDHKNIWVQPYGDMGYHRRVQIIYDTIIDPDSITARLGRRQDWLNFGIRTNDDTYTSQLLEGKDVPDELKNELESKEQRLREKADDTINSAQNRFMNSVREFTRRRNL